MNKEYFIFIFPTWQSIYELCERFILVKFVFDKSMWRLLYKKFVEIDEINREDI